VKLDFKRFLELLKCDLKMSKFKKVIISKIIISEGATYGTGLIIGLWKSVTNCLRKL